MNVMDHQPDLWMSGIFTVQDAADLVGVRARLARTWVAGQKGRQAPVIESQLGLVDGQIAISFTNLMELRFISAFHKAGFRLPYIRRILDEAKSFLQHPHPTTTEVFFRTDGAKIFGTVERKKTVDVLYDLESKNYAMFPIIRESLKKDMELQSVTH